MKVTDIIKLDDKKEYLVAAKIEHKEKTYLCLADMVDHNNIRYGYLDKENIVFVSKLDRVVLMKLFSQMTSFVNDITK